MRASRVATINTVKSIAIEMNRLTLFVTPDRYTFRNLEVLSIDERR